MNTLRNTYKDYKLSIGAGIDSFKTVGVYAKMDYEEKDAGSHIGIR